jgi:syntaxin-binding protein 1
MERIRRSAAFKHIQSLREVGVDWWVQEARLFHLDAPISNSNVYYSPSVRPSLLQYELDIVAAKIVSFFVCLGMEPATIRYCAGGGGGGDGPPRAGILATSISRALARHTRHNPGWTSEKRFRAPILLLLDRTFDPLSPFMHDFGYQALLRDMLGVKYR